MEPPIGVLPENRQLPLSGPGSGNRSRSMRRPRAWPNAGHAPGQGRTPPGHTRVPCEELADGVDPRESWPKARTGPRKTPRWSAERRPRSSKGSAARRIRTRLIGAPSPRFVEGDEKAPQSGAGVTAYPGPVKNAGVSACPPLRPARRQVGISGNCALHSPPLFGYIRALSRSG